MVSVEKVTMTDAYGNVGTVIYLLVLTCVGYSTFLMAIAASALVGFLTLFFMEESKGTIAEVNEDGDVELIQVG